MSHRTRFRAAFVTATTVVTALALSIFLSGAVSAGPTLTWQRQDVTAQAPGWYSSLVMDSLGRPHVAYRESGSLIKYAWYDGTKWRGEASSVSPDTVFTGSVGYLLSLALDPDGHPRIAFSASGTARYVAWDGDSWEPSTVQAEAGHNAGFFPSLAIDGEGTPHLSYIDCTGGSDSRNCSSGGRLMYATLDNGSWARTWIDQSVAVNGDTSLALDSTGSPHIAYYAPSGSKLKYASLGAGVWAVDEVASPAGMGLSLDLYDDRPRIAYATASGSLRLASRSGGSWATSILGPTTWSATLGGMGPELGVDASDVAHIVYAALDGSHAIIRYGRYDGTWESEPVSVSSWYDYYPSLALDGAGRPRVTYFKRVTGTTGPLVYAHVNAPPSAAGDSATVDEDSTLTADVLANDVSGYGFSGQLTLTQIKTAPSSGTASVVAGKVSYTPNEDWNGADSLVYEVCDQNGTPALCSDATLGITVSSVNDLPALTADPTSMTVQYGDPMAASISVTGSDVESAPDQLSFSATGLPAGLTLTDNLDGTATIEGTPTGVAGTHQVTVSATDLDGGTGTLTVPITVAAESVLVRPAQSNPHAVLTTATGAPAMTFTARITETADGTYDVPGHLSEATIEFRLGPVGGGQSHTCVDEVTKSVDATPTTPAFIDVSCTFGAGIGVDVYELTITVSGGHYQGVGTSGVTVFDPSGVDPKGGGTVAISSGNGEFFFTAKYLKSRQVQGKMLFVLTASDGSQTVLKGNVMSTMAIKEGTAVITGKATLNGVGNYTYVLTAVDNGENGDLFGLEVKGPDKKPVSLLTFAPAPVDGDAVHVAAS
jgi:hypothetical protein